ncbi:Uncharacterised protein [Burkholderia oklahomensis]|nr:NAD(P)H dehydrogenase [Burkholderia oklahomensis C6786]KUY50079.1 NAD(P)H dehydrogenase [Burkholderia oklahomensis C6786]SUY27956.1 Uncharacterised protein [Burkholderia oklahomensis]
MNSCAARRIARHQTDAAICSRNHRCAGSRCERSCRSIAISKPGTSTGGSTICDSLGQRLDDLSKIEPIPFRPQNAGADEIAQLTLRAGVVPQRSGFAAHVA